jgi:hypothetical protein
VTANGGRELRAPVHLTHSKESFMSPLRFFLGPSGVVVALAALGWILGVSPDPLVYASETEGFSPYVDEEGNITLPLDYMTEFTHLGTFALKDELHGVYARPSDVSAYRRTGEFPDGAVIVKDVYSVDTELLTTGNSSYAKQMKIWFVMIKDTKGRFEGNELWGDGWGWALFEAEDPTKQVAADYRLDCRTCHLPAKNEDWIYVRGYPVLRRTSASG